MLAIMENYDVDQGISLYRIVTFDRIETIYIYNGGIFVAEQKKTFYITTPIYYPSGKFHIGTAYTTVASDAMARYKRLRGYDVRFLTGMDEHGKKYRKKRKKQDYRRKNMSMELLKLQKKCGNIMDISYDDFIRTTEERHKEVLKRFSRHFSTMAIFIKVNTKDGIVYLVKRISQKRNLTMAIVQIVDVLSKK